MCFFVYLVTINTFYLIEAGELEMQCGIKKPQVVKPLMFIVKKGYPKYKLQLLKQLPIFKNI